MKIKLLLIALAMLTVLPVWGQPQLNKSRQLIHQGKFQDALSELRTIIAKPASRTNEAYYLMADAFIGLKLPDSALALGQRLRDEDGKSPAGYVILARSYMAKKDNKEAHEILTKGRQSTKNNAEVLHQFGLLYLAMDSTNQAVVAFSQAKEANTKYAAPFEGLGDAYLKMGSAGMAILQYESYTKMDSTNSNLLEKLARTYHRERQYTKAAMTYFKVAQLDTTNSEVLFTLGRLYFQAKQYGNASRVFQTYVKRFPASAEGWALYMESLYMNKQYKDARDAAEKVRQNEPNSKKALAVIAHAQYELKEYDKAVQTYQQLAKIDTLGLENEKRLGKAYAANKQDSLAAITLEKVLRSDTSQTDLYNDLGTIYMRSRKYHKATAMFEQRFKRDPNATTAYINYALSAMALGRWDSARIALLKVTSLRPDYIPGQVALARTYSQIDSLKRAARVYEKVVQLADTAVVKYRVELAEAHGIIGVNHLIDKKLEAALDELNTAIRLKDDDPQTRLWRAQTLWSLKRNDDALKEYKVVLRLDPRNKTAKEDMEKLKEMGVQ